MRRRPGRRPVDVEPDLQVGSLHKYQTYPSTELC